MLLAARHLRCEQHHLPPAVSPVEMAAHPLRHVHYSLLQTQLHAAVRLRARQCIHRVAAIQAKQAAQQRRLLLLFLPTLLPPKLQFAARVQAAPHIHQAAAMRAKQAAQRRLLLLFLPTFLPPKLQFAARVQAAPHIHPAAVMRIKQAARQRRILRLFLPTRLPLQFQFAARVQAKPHIHQAAVIQAKQAAQAWQVLPPLRHFQTALLCFPLQRLQPPPPARPRVRQVWRSPSPACTARRPIPAKFCS